MESFGADPNAIAHVDEIKIQALKEMQTSNHFFQNKLVITEEGTVKKGDLVRLKAMPDCVGAVVDVLPGPGELRYQVFHDGKVVTYYASQVELSEPLLAHPTVGIETLHAALSSLQLCHPSISSLYSLFASRIHFVPYQFRPVIKLIQADRPRLLIADEVGVGKTIEAVLLLSATPIQLGDNDLYNLLHLLRPDLIPGRREFDQMAEPNPHINAAIEAARSARPDWKAAALSSLDKALTTPWGRNVLRCDERLQEAHDYLESDYDQTESRLSVIREMENLYTFSPLINRTRRQDIGSFTTRKPETVAVEYTEEQSGLHASG